MPAKFRFVVSETMKEELINFSKTHLNEERKKIKEAWTNWTEENMDFIIDEKNELIGYNGSLDEFVNKLFFSVKYYYMKIYKNGDCSQKETELDTASETENVDKKIKLSKKIIKQIDKHIQSVLQNKICPAECYLDFINTNKEFIYSEIISSSYGDYARVYFEKIKKCYKNRYYNARSVA